MSRILLFALCIALCCVSLADAFLRLHGYEKTPSGYQVDHIIPLCAGGPDTPENMQLLTVEEHRQKTRVDVRWCRLLKKIEGR